MSPDAKTADRQPVWFKSSYSGGNTTECVECAHAPQTTYVRDSKSAQGPVLSLESASWGRFVAALCRGDV
ncbi:DUF397 domain-containing protein [Streptomyces sp. NPDC048182]|uniref:DUF397 domain-containing protein n=1 Tax=Streptomyces sp. NPDC048182 TaxID=3365507 RepID=UPI0037178349